MLFCIPQRYDFSSKSQLDMVSSCSIICCFVYRKGTIFRANHNTTQITTPQKSVVLYTAKVRFFKQITTQEPQVWATKGLFCIPQRYDFSSKSQQKATEYHAGLSCFVYRKGTIFQANHNHIHGNIAILLVVLYTAKVRFFKQITTYYGNEPRCERLFCIPQRYDFSSKSQRKMQSMSMSRRCFVYRKGTIFQANHNCKEQRNISKKVVLYTAKVRFFKQITTGAKIIKPCSLLFCIPQRYDFSSKSQQVSAFALRQVVVLYTAKVRFFKQITTLLL